MILLTPNILSVMYFAVLLTKTNPTSASLFVLDVCPCKRVIISDYKQDKGICAFNVKYVGNSKTSVNFTNTSFLPENGGRREWAGGSKVKQLKTSKRQTIHFRIDHSERRVSIPFYSTE